MKRLALLLLLLGPMALAQPQKTVKEFLKLSKTDTTSYVVKGVVEKVRSSTSGSFYLQDATGTLLVYGLQDPADPSRSFKQMDILKGDTLTVLGRFTIYGGSTLEMKDGRLIAKADGPDHKLSFLDRLEQKPSFKGKPVPEGTEAFKAWLRGKIKGSGSVRMRFVVGRNGGVQEVEVQEASSPEIKAEVLKVMASAPKWKPAKADGSAIRMPITVDVEF